MHPKFKQGAFWLWVLTFLLIGIQFNQSLMFKNKRIMKKIVASFLILLFVVTMKTNGQGHDSPILPRIYEDGYSIEQIKNFALKDSNELGNSFRERLIYTITNGLIQAGEYVNYNNGNPIKTSKKDISRIFEYVIRNEKDSLPAYHRNTYKDKD